MISRPSWAAGAVLLVLAHCAFQVWGCTAISSRPPKGVYHTVRKGETLWRICSTYRVNMETVCRRNGIKDPERIQEGQKIFLPGVSQIKVVPQPGAVRAGGVADRRAGAIQDDQHRSPQPAPAVPEPSPRESADSACVWPVKGSVTTWFGVNDGRRHDGIDIVAPKGTPIRAVDKGKVVYSDHGIPGYGNLIIIQHSSGINSVYAGNDRNYVHVDHVVGKGQVIGEVGETGREGGGPHLHFEIRKGSAPVDPMEYLP